MDVLENHIDKLRELNSSLEQTLYGTNTGGKSWYDEFWDNIQDYGKLKDYTYAFGTGWNGQNFKPKYDFKIKSMYGMFYHFGSYTRDGIIHNGFDFKGCLEKAGVKLDMSQTIGVTQAFMYCKIAHLPPLDFRNVISLSSVFRESYTTSVEITLRGDGTNTFDANCFWAEKLESLTVNGVIGNTVTFNKCTKLSKASIENIISCLSSTASGMILTLSTTAVNNAFGGSTREEWLNLVAPKPNWTISLS